MARKLTLFRRFAIVLIFSVAIVSCVLGLYIVRSIIGMRQQEPVATTALPAADPVPATILVQANDQEPADSPERIVLSSEETAPTIDYLMMEQDIAACVPPSTQLVEVQERQQIFRWIDADGRVSYGDRPPAGVTADQYETDEPDRMDYFDFSIQYLGTASVSYISDRLRAHTTAIFDTLSDLVGIERLRRIDLQVVMYADRARYLEYAKSVTGADMLETTGFYTTRTNEAVTYLQPTQNETLEVARHEATHVIVRAMLGEPPIWLNEGLAEYFSMLTVSGTFHQVDIQPVQLQRARRALESGYPPTLSTFFSLNRQLWSNERVQEHYALAWGLVYFMMSSEQGRISLASLMHAFADDFCTTISTRRLLDEFWPGGTSGLQQEYFAWLQNMDNKRPHVY